MKSQQPPKAAPLLWLKIFMVSFFRKNSPAKIGIIKLLLRKNFVSQRSNFRNPLAPKILPEKIHSKKFCLTLFHFVPKKLERYQKIFPNSSVSRSTLEKTGLLFSKNFYCGCYMLSVMYILVCFFLARSTVLRMAAVKM